MHIEHIAIWTTDLERLRAFYETYFEAKAGSKYINHIRQFQSYFLSFASGARLEIMTIPGIEKTDPTTNITPAGYAHLALALDSKAQVDTLTERLRADGYPILDGPRTTGDGYYESSALDPDGNRIEITIASKQ